MGPFSRGLGWLLLAGLAAFAAGGSAQPTDADAPFRISGNHRYLVDRHDVPFLLQGDAGWSLIVNATNEEAEAYFQNRRAKGFTAILVNLIEHKFARNAPRNVYGEAPFPSMSDWTVQNERYFAHADWVIRKAAENGLVVLLAPVYLGYPGMDEGFYDEVMANGPEKCLAYGHFLGQQLQGLRQHHLGDGGRPRPRSGAGECRHGRLRNPGIRPTPFDDRALPLGLRPGRAISRFVAPGQHFYAYEIVHLRLTWDYERKPVMPLFLIESIYEGEHNSSAVQIRRQAYWAVLCGEFGHVMGNHPLWDFGPGWQAAMDAPGSMAMMHWGRLFRSRPWYDLVPDKDHQVVTGGLGEFWGLDYLTAAATPDGGMVIAYLPTARTVTVNLSKLANGRANAWWFDPRTGKATAAGTFATEGSKDFTPPAEGDWVLVLDDASQQLPAPGQ